MHHYWKFLAENWRFLAFGVLTAMLSGYGQTFYIAVFGGELRADFNLSHSEFGLLYSLATLGSGLLIVWAGRKLDTMSLAWFVTLVSGGVVAGALLLSVAQTAIMLGLALFLLRFCGQGLFTHVSATSMGRYFDQNRGKAVSIAAKGLPLSEAVMPAIGVALIAAIGWRATWFWSAVIMAVFFLPLLLWLLRGHSQQVIDHATSQRKADAEKQACAPRQWTRAEVLRDKRFYRLLPAVLAAPLTVTAILFHLAYLAEGKDWSMAWVAGSFTGFALAHVAGLMFAGPLLDKIGARPILRFYLLPMMLGLLILAWFDQPITAWVFMLLTGLSLGGAGTLLGALWPMLYGVVHLGSIRAVVHAAMVLSTAITPYAAGVALDLGWSMEDVALALAVYIALALALAWRVLDQPVNR
ncbi:MAG TPA: MFS transporter [Halothiobacillaceae bacterium]|nr:MFS transporter [Halothiobacillaceae bacterium]